MFSARDIQDAVDMNATISNRSDRHILHKHGYGYHQRREKGVLTAEDLPKRLKSDQKCK